MQEGNNIYVGLEVHKDTPLHSVECTWLAGHQSRIAFAELAGIICANGMQAQRRKLDELPTKARQPLREDGKKRHP